MSAEVASARGRHNLFMVRVFGSSCDLRRRKRDARLQPQWVDFRTLGALCSYQSRSDRGGKVRDVLTYDLVIDLVRARPDLRLIGIDGLSLAGKSTLAGQLAMAAGGVCIQLDDFVKPESEWRWHDRPSFPFDYIRYDEFMATVRHVAENGWCQYRPYNWETGMTEDIDRVVKADGPVIVEGVSALHPDLAPLYGLRIWVESDAASTFAASMARGVGAWMREWEELFLPSVGLYLETDPRTRADVLAAGRGFAVQSPGV